VSVRAALDALLVRLPAQLRSPGSGGAACRAIADVYDAAIAERFEQACAGIATPLALVATGGLDPLGIQRVLNEAVKIKPQCSSVIMFYADFMRLHEPLELFNKVIEVS